MELYAEREYGKLGFDEKNISHTWDDRGFPTCPF